MEQQPRAAGVTRPVPHGAEASLGELAPALLDAVGQAVLLLTLDGRVRYLNRAAEELYQWTADEALGRSAGDLLVPAERRDDAREIMEALRVDGRWSGEFDVLRRDGSVVPVLVTNTLVHDGAGEVVGMVGVAADLSDRRESDAVVAASERRLSTILSNASDIISLISADGRLDYVSPSLGRVLGYDEGDAPLDPFELIHPDDKAVLHRMIRRASVRPSAGAMVEFRCRAASGEWRTFEAVGNNLLHDPAVNGLVVTARDITTRRRGELERQASEARLRAVLAHSPVAIFAVDVTGIITVGEGEASKASGIDMPSLVGSDARVLWGTEHPALVAAIDGALGGQHSMVREPLAGRWWEVQMRPSVDEHGAITGAIGVSLDVTERVAAEGELKRLALHDPLTGLANRTLALDRLGHAVKGRGRRCVGVLFIDVDDFKSVNDGLGHAAGDALLNVFASRLRLAVRANDTVARFGGDEFLVISERLERPGDAIELAERLLVDLAAPVRLEGVDVTPSVSIGIAVAVATAETDVTVGADDLIRDADTAMYQAKRDGRGRLRVFDPGLHIDVLTRLRTEAELRTALADGQFAVHYQPVHDLVTGTMVGVEALVRWCHPRRGLVPPGDFIPVAEETGLIVELGEHVLGEACRQVGAWQSSGHRLGVAVNLSAHQLRDPELDRRVRRVLDASDLDPSWVTLEVTETALMDDLDDAVAVLGKLRSLGVCLSIDDFGTGYSSLSHLRELPVQQLKIDRTFVSGLTDTAKDAAIVHAVIDLAHALGLQVVGEGIEEPGQRDALSRWGCELGQGYLLGHPVPAHAITTQLDAALASRLSPNGAGRRPHDGYIRSSRAGVPGA